MIGTDIKNNYNINVKIVAKIGRPNLRFHDLRHSYATMSLYFGDDVKTVQANLGHATASFTLDIYGHFTNQMSKESSARMQAYIDTVLNV
jgi:integrase